MPSDAATPEQRLAKRKTHRKSRNGCFQCKQRHTKCNEEHPRCGNCVRLDIACTWPSRPEGFSPSYPTPPESHGPIHVDTPPSNKPDDSSSTFGSELGIADLRLLHHWTTKAYKDMSSHGLEKLSHWQVDFVEIAFEFPSLLRGFLATSALHKIVCDPQADKQSLLLQADLHISKALTTYRENLEQQNDEIAIPMFLLSSMLVTYNLASAQLVVPEDPINAMQHCFRLIQGVKIVMEPHWEQIQASKTFADIVGNERPSENPTVTDIGEVLRLKKLAEMKKASAGEIYNKAIDDLQACFVRTRQCSPGQYQLSAVWGWAARLTDDFSHLLTIHDPIAVLILAHFAVLLAEAPNCWLTRGWPQWIVFAAQKLLMATPELLDYLDWPLRMINVDS